MDEYDYQPPNSNTGLIVVSGVVVLLACIIAFVIIYRHSHPVQIPPASAKSDKAAVTEDKIREARRVRELSYLVIEIVVALAALSFQICIATWVAKDAKNRSDDGGALWAFLVFFVPVAGLLVYLGTRAKGLLGRCAKCGSKRLPQLSPCPHCGSA